MSYPIILAHGVSRFDQLWNGAFEIDNNDDPKMDRLHYFKGVRTMLMQHGFRVYHSHVPWADGVDVRAADLHRNVRDVLAKAKAPKVNIIAHSMGGLDARHMLFDFRVTDPIHEQVASLTTISTPHQGSPFADWGTDNLSFVVPLAKKIGISLHAFYDLRTDRCRRFNHDPAVVAFETDCEAEIQFRTYAGCRKSWGLFDTLRISQAIIENQEGENDGLVSVASAKWRDRYFQGLMENVDHFNELGWREPGRVFEHESEQELLDRVHAFYLEIARQLP